MSTVLSKRWMLTRQPFWERLGVLVSTAEQSGVTHLSREQLRELALLYRQGASDLSTLRLDRTSSALSIQLNDLLSRAHQLIYSRHRPGWRRLARFLTVGYPEVFQQQLRYTLAAILIMTAGAVLATALSLANPRFAASIAGPAVMSSIARHQMWTQSLVTVAPMAASGIMTNNITVSFTAYAGGMLFGLGSIYLMFVNGLMLGAVGVLCQHAGMSIPLWSFVAGHGSIELPAIAIAGGAGLRLGAGMLFPGLLRWKDSVALAGRDSVRLVSGVVPMLIVAGTLEGFFSPSSAPVALKFSLGAVLLALLNLWLFRPTRPAPDQANSR